MSLAKWSIDLEDFKERTHLSPIPGKMEPKILVPLPAIDPKTISCVHVMAREYLKKLIWNIPLEGDKNEKPYKNCKIEVLQQDPRRLHIGQTFVMREKYEAIAEKFWTALDRNFCVNGGIAKKQPTIIFGKTYEGIEAVAHYLPPIIEARGEVPFLLDGIHRNFLAMAVGTTIESIVIESTDKERPLIELPCSVHTWSEVKIVNEKPPREERFFNLKPELFRDLKYIGIDG